MNYRHAFHAGNHADILKHTVLLAALAAMTRKDSPLAVLDTHAGAGAYDLASDAALRSPEWRDGIGRLRAAPDGAPEAVRALLAAAGEDPTHYPGSPKIALAALRAQDRLIACELHPEDAQTLRRRLAGDPRAQVHCRDGFAAVGALLPFPERRGLVLIDPPYEADDDLARSAAAIAAGVRRFRNGVYLWWRPLKAGGALDAADRELAMLGLPMLRCDLAVDAPQSKGSLKASSMLALNPPFGMEFSVEEALQFLAPGLAQGSGARYMVAGSDR